MQCQYVHPNAISRTLETTCSDGRQSVHLTAAGQLSHRGTEHFLTFPACLIRDGFLARRSGARASWNVHINFTRPP